MTLRALPYDGSTESTEPQASDSRPLTAAPRPMRPPASRSLPLPPPAPSRNAVPPPPPSAPSSFPPSAPLNSLRRVPPPLPRRASRVTPVAPPPVPRPYIEPSAESPDMSPRRSSIPTKPPPSELYAVGRNGLRIPTLPRPPRTPSSAPLLRAKFIVTCGERPGEIVLTAVTDLRAVPRDALVVSIATDGERDDRRLAQAIVGII